MKKRYFKIISNAICCNFVILEKLMEKRTIKILTLVNKNVEFLARCALVVKATRETEAEKLLNPGI